MNIIWYNITSSGINAAAVDMGYASFADMWDTLSSETRQAANKEPTAMEVADKEFYAELWSSWTADWDGDGHVLDVHLMLSNYEMLTNYELCDSWEVVTFTVGMGWCQPNDNDIAQVMRGLTDQLNGMIQGLDLPGV